MTRDREPWDDADVAFLFSRANGVIARCPAPELLSASRAGTLPPDLQTAISAHLEACVVCRMLADALDDDTITMLQPAESERIAGRIRQGIEEPRRSWTAVQRGLLAAAVLLVAIAAWRIVPQPSPEAPTNPAPATHVAVFDIASAPMLPSDAQGLLASNRRPEERVALLEGLIPYRQGDYDRAATQFAALVARDPQSAAGHFYLGLSELMRGRNPNAVAALDIASRQASADTEDATQILWYLAIAHYRTDRRDLASATLTKLCNGRSSRWPPACAALAEISIPRTLRVTVSDVSGTPLSGATVGEHAPSQWRPLIVYSFTPFSGRTDAAGRLELTGVSVGTSERLLVRAAKPGYFTSTAWLPAFS